MIHSLQNADLKITVADYGAELKSITGADGTEYLFDGNPKWWKYTSPVLFPFVGKVVGNKYRVEGKEFELPQHGFARTSNFECVSETQDKIIFQLKWTDQTLKVYPYKFLLEISYALKKNTVAVNWTVKNLDDKPIYFSIGAHPALKCPIVDGENFNDCYLKFNVAEKSARILLAASGNLSHEKVPTLDGTTLNLNYEIFKGDALVFDDLKSDEISICSKKSSKSITLQAKGFPFWGIWTPSNGGAPFVCIEPWHGHADFEDFSGDFTEKDGINKLEIGASFNAGYNLTARS
ncbi:MAG: aldose 1-epimerase family protein [Selenomonadaceae bacterium]|nr:aldose 1-epimerase family protein [Selenomonadaceae bacterium]